MLTIFGRTFGFGSKEGYAEAQEYGSGSLCHLVKGKYHKTHQKAKPYMLGPEDLPGLIANGIKIRVENVLFDADN